MAKQTALLPNLRQDIEARLAELRPVVEECRQLEAVKAVLAQPGDGHEARHRASFVFDEMTVKTKRLRPEAKRARAPRGANRAAIFSVIDEQENATVDEIVAKTKIAKATVATTLSQLGRKKLLRKVAKSVARRGGQQAWCRP